MGENRSVCEGERRNDAMQKVAKEWVVCGERYRERSVNSWMRKEKYGPLRGKDERATEEQGLAMARLKTKGVNMGCSCGR